MIDMMIPAPPVKMSNTSGYMTKGSKQSNQLIKMGSGGGSFKIEPPYNIPSTPDIMGEFVEVDKNLILLT